MASRPAQKAKIPTKAAAPAPRGRQPAAAAPARAAAPAAPAKAAVPSVVTLKTLAEELATAHELPKKTAAAMLDDMVQRITAHLRGGDRIRFGALGILEVKHRPARTGRNPATGEAVQIKASRKVAFRAAKALKEAI